jgi:hypothetical protein
MGFLSKPKKPEMAEDNATRDELVKILEAAKQLNQNPPKQPMKSEKTLLGGSKMPDFEGIILDMGEGMSLNIPIERRMSLHDFLKIAEKVKKLELMQLEADQPIEEHHHH